MDKSQVIALFDQDQRRDVMYPDQRREVTPHVVRHIATSDTKEGMIVYSQLTEANADEAIREEVRFFESIGQNFEWKLYDYDQPHDLKERLASYGFVVGEAEAIMVLDLAAAPETLWKPAPLTVRRITDPAKLVDIQAIEEEVWNEDSSWVVEYLGDTLRRHPEWMSVYAVYVDEQPASAAWVYFSPHSQFASLWGGSTVSRYRKQGHYTALLSARAQEARARGVRYLTVDASPMSRPILEKFGFERIATAYPCTWESRPREADQP